MKRWVGPAVVGGLGVVVAVLATIAVRARTAWVRADHAIRSGDWEDASSALDTYAWYRGEANVAYNRARARVESERGRPLAAADALGRLPRTNQDAADIQFQRAWLLLQGFRLREAEAALEECLRIEPDHPGALRTLASFLALENRDAEFESALWRWHDAGSSSERVEALRLLAPGMTSLPPRFLPSDMEEGRVLREAVDADPADAHARVALADLARRRGDLAQAESLLVPLRPTFADAPEALAVAIERSLDAGQLDEIEPTVQAADPLAREQARVWVARAERHRLLGQPDRAKSCLDRALAIAPRNSEILHRLAQLALQTGDRDRAKSLIEQVEMAKDLIALVGPGIGDVLDPEVYPEAARLCRALGRDREAQAWLALEGTP